MAGQSVAAESHKEQFPPVGVVGGGEIKGGRDVELDGCGVGGWFGKGRSWSGGVDDLALGYAGGR